MKVIIDPHYSSLKSFLENLVSPGWFEHNGITIHSGRNVIKQFNVDGISLAVKYYGHLSMVNRLVYGVLRKSKGQRSYEYAKKLADRGIDTPKEVAYIELRSKGLLQDCYFVSLYSDFNSLKDAVELYPDNKEIKLLLNELAAFLVRMHDAGIIHKDLNISNILYKKNPNIKDDDGYAYKFQIIDTNRMKFRRHIGTRRRLHNLRRLSCKPEAFVYILREYAEAANRNPTKIELKGIISRLLFEQKKQFKREIKEKLKK